MVDLPTPDARDRAEASIVTGQRSGHQFEMQLGHLCNNRCVFCVSGHLTELGMAKPIDLKPILDTIDEAYASGASRLVFLGGEPTLHKGFLPALEHAAKLGFGEIVIFTNGVRLPQPGFIDSCLALGTFTWRISIQGANEEAHVAVTKKPRSFQRIIEGIEILRQRGQRVTTNMCVNEQSYRSLPDYPALVAKYDIKQLHIDIVRPSSTGRKSAEYLREIMPRYSAMAPYYDEMMAGFEVSDPDFDINIGNLPFCILPKWAHKIHHAGEATITRSAGLDGFEEDVDKYEVHKAQRTYTARCGTCAFRARCTGVFRDYLDLYGADEFQPVSIDELRGLDPQMNNFTVLAEGHVATLIDAPRHELPGGWRLAEHFADARSRQVGMRFVRAAGGAATLYAAPPPGVGRPVHIPPPVLVTDRYQIGLAVEGWFPEEDLLALTRWAAARLTSVDGVAVETPLDEDAVRAARGEDPALGRSRARMLRLVRRVQQQARFGGWRYAGTQTLPGGRGVVMHVDGPEGFRVNLSIEIGSEGGRSQVQALFSLGEGTDESVARPVIEDIVRALREPEPRAELR